MLCCGARIAKEVVVAQKGAADTVRWLAPLQPLLDKVAQSDDFPALTQEFGRLMQMLLLVWTHAKYYATYARLLTLLRRISDVLIVQTAVYLPGINLLLHTE